MERRNDRTTERRNDGTTERWNDGKMERWNGGTMERWNNRTMEKKYLELLWSMKTLQAPKVVRETRETSL